ncbi:acetate--CoA ligase family protein [Candidatus Spongiihabitans sp.]|uniref:acetate--CoA ligase family protein n=1 Tax=Candidatus Spongiihabitans sp. TaxID=3101308 RepID=UPI003C7CC044
MTVDAQRVARCLNPKSIAVVGGKEADRVVEQCLKFGFAGDIWPINRKRKTMQGLPCFNSLAQLLDEVPAAPDATFVAIPAADAIDIIAQLNHAGAGGAICYSSGFREVGADGVARHRQLLHAAADMPVFGPNCLGYINTLSGAALWPEQHGLTRSESGVAIFSCSGNVSINFTLQQRGLPVAWLVTVGNQAVLGIEECIAAALDANMNANMNSGKITAIGIHIEGLNNLPLFVELAHRAHAKRIPIIALKTGKSDLGARITLSHTATLAGESELYTALFERLGIGQVETIEEFLEALKLVAVTGPLTGNRLSSMSCSGGEAALIADLSVAREIHFPKVEPDHKKKLQATLNEYVNVDNPLDYHTFIWGDQERSTATFSAMMDGKYDLNLLIIDIPQVTGGDAEEWEHAIQAFIDARAHSGGAAATVSIMSETMTDSVREKLIENGITPLQGMQQALAAIEAACRIGMTWNMIRDGRRLPPKIQVSTTAVEAHQVYGLDEYQAKQLLKQAGVAVPASSLVSSQAEAARAAAKIGYPLALKAVAAEMTHKSELNAVVVGIASVQQLEQEVERLLNISESLLVEEMVEDAVAELLLGVSHDPQFGHYLVVGFGGTMVELIGDSEILLLPICRDEVIRALKKLKTWPLLNSFRGRPLADVDKVVDTALAIANLVQQRKDDIVELEINPLMVKGRRQGVVAADALVRMRKL